MRDAPAASVPGGWRWPPPCDAAVLRTRRSRSLGTPLSNITVENTHCYGTHGISIGSQTGGGVSNVLVLESTIDGRPSNLPPPALVEIGRASCRETL